MDREGRRKFEDYRRNEAGPVENTVIDELLAGEMDRSEFVKRGTMFGLSASVIGAALVAAGEAPMASARASRAQAGGRMRVGIIPKPVAAIEPHLFADQGGLETGSICGEHLIRIHPGLRIGPELATKWTPNANASIWTVNLRPGAKFQTGQPFGADDVVATYKRLTDPKSGSQALSAFKGVISPAGIRKVDNLTVAFHLDAPTASFPYLLSSTVYQSIILPANYKIGTFTSTPQTTGALMLTSYTPGVSA